MINPLNPSCPALLARCLFSLYLLLTAASHATAVSDDSLEKSLAACNVSWEKLGIDSADSMPLGNGDIGLNVWTEQKGDILFYISKTDAWTENGDLVKVGRVRVSLTPNPFTDNTPFEQVLKLKNGEICVSSPTLTLRIWVDAHHPIVRVEVDSSSSVAVKVTLDPWRTEMGKPEVKADKTSADVVLPPGGDRLTWYHRNGKSIAPQLENITFGACIEGEGLITGEGHTLVSKVPARTLRFGVHVLTATVPLVEEWLQTLENQRARDVKLDWESCRNAHQAWWQEFWQRSWIYVEGDADASKITQGYMLQRFKTACAGRGATAIKFNGSLFTVDSPAEKTGKDKVTKQDIIIPVTADFRAWGGRYWFQNTRAMYWPRLAAGDFDLMQPFFRQYRAQLESNAAQVKAHYGHEGSYFAETAPYWGGVPHIKPDQAGSYTLRYFTPILELSSMMLDYYAYTGDKEFIRLQLLPVALAGLKFFENHFPRDEQGRLLLDKNNAIEMYWDVCNPLPDIAGLHWVTQQLLQLPADLLDDAGRKQVTALVSILPELPIGMKEGKKVLLPAAEGQELKPRNSENPELYAVYPFRLYGVGKPDLDTAINTFNVRIHKRSGCWHQDPVHAAYLGLTEEARKGVLKCLTNYDKRLKFPAFWERGHDYAPDEDNGGNGENGLQLMLMQCEGEKIFLLPAWPKNWNAEFKLHAPYNTTLKGTIKDGKVSELEVSPESRAKDIVRL